MEERRHHGLGKDSVRRWVGFELARESGEGEGGQSWQGDWHGLEGCILWGWVGVVRRVAGKRQVMELVWLSCRDFES